MDVSSATAFVTGANRGIGRHLVDTLLGAGVAKIYAGTRDPASVAFDDDRVVNVGLDITDAAQVAAAARAAGDTTLLINNAGVLDFGTFLDADAAQVSRNMDVNYFGTLEMCRAFAPVISGNGGGTIVNVLTLVALASMPSLSVYNASKAAAWSMTQALRATLLAQGVRMVGVFPGAVDTDMLASVDMPKTPPADIATAIVAGLRDDAEDIFPDPMSQALYADWRADHKAVERQFASM